MVGHVTQASGCVAHGLFTVREDVWTKNKVETMHTTDHFGSKPQMAGIPRAAHTHTHTHKHTFKSLESLASHKSASSQCADYTTC